MPGAGGSIAAAHVAKAAPDGYTLLVSGDAALVTNISLYDKLAYNPVKDLAPISQLVATPNVLVVPADLPVKSVAELAALVRSSLPPTPSLTADSASPPIFPANCSRRWRSSTSSTLCSGRRSTRT